MHEQYSSGNYQGVKDLYDYLSVFTKKNNLHEYHYPEYMMGLAYDRWGQKEKAIVCFKKRLNIINTCMMLICV